jgi:hypothetical protein
MDADAIANVEAALKRACSHPKCISCEAILDAAKQLIPDPAGWIVKKNGDEISLYAIVGPSLHVIRGRCKPSEDALGDEPETDACDYRLIHATDEATFNCKIERTERRDRAPQTLMTWRFTLNREDEGTIEVTSKPDDDQADRHLADSFARALVTEVAHLRRDG